MRAPSLVAAALATVALAGCSDPANTQYLPIGSRCSSAGQCGTLPFDCATAGFVGGYCTKPCTTDGDCPLDAICAMHECRRRCSSTTDCRAAEGYDCAVVSGATSTVCVPGTGAMDLGPPSG